MRTMRCVYLRKSVIGQGCSRRVTTRFISSCRTGAPRCSVLWTTTRTRPSPDSRHERSAECSRSRTSSSSARISASYRTRLLDGRRPSALAKFVITKCRDNPPQHRRGAEYSIGSLPLQPFRGKKPSAAAGIPIATHVFTGHRVTVRYMESAGKKEAESTTGVCPARRPPPRGKIGELWIARLR